MDGETEIKIKDREIENADKQMANLLNEYNHVKKRIEQVGDFNYAVELKSKVNENESKIKENEKKIKEMEQDQKRRDIQMNRLVKEEKTEKMRRVDYKHSKLTYLQEKINELEAKIETLKTVKQEQDEQETETKQKYTAMLRIGESYGITEKNIDNEDQIFRNKLLEKYQQLARKEKHLETEIESIEKSYKVEIKEKKKLVKEYTDKKRQLGKEIIQTISDIRAKANQLDGLITKMKGFEMGEDILNKWSEENKKLLEKLDKDEKTALETEELEIKPKVPKQKKKVENSPPKKNSVVEKNPSPPPKPQNKPAEKPNLNISKQSINENIAFEPEPIVQKEEAPAKPANKPFGKMGGGNTKPAFGKPFGKPFGGSKENANSSINQSHISNDPEPVKKEEPSFTDKYNLNSNVNANVNPNPIGNNSRSSVLSQKPVEPEPKAAAPWLANKPSISNNNNESNNDYVPSTMGEGRSRRQTQGQNQNISQNQSQIKSLSQNQKEKDTGSAIPTLSDETKGNGVAVKKVTNPFGTKANKDVDFSERFNLGGNTEKQSELSQRNQVNQPFQAKSNFNAIPTIGKESPKNDPFNIPTLSDKPKDNDFTNMIPTIGETSSKEVNIPTIGESRRRPTNGFTANADTNNDVGGYVPSGFDSKANDSELPGGRRRVADPFAKAAPSSNNAGGGFMGSNATKPSPFNNISGISGTSSNRDNMFSKAGTSNQPGFMDKLKDGNKNEPKKADFWSDFLNDDPKPKPDPKQKADVRTIAPTSMNNNSKPQNSKGTFHDVADLEDELILD